MDSADRYFAAKAGIDIRKVCKNCKHWKLNKEEDKEFLELIHGNRRHCKELIKGLMFEHLHKFSQIQGCIPLPDAEFGCNKWAARKGLYEVENE